MSGYTDTGKRVGIVHQAECYLPIPVDAEARDGAIEALAEAIRNISPARVVEISTPARPNPSFDDLLKFEKVKVALDDQMFVKHMDGTKVPWTRKEPLDD